MNDWKEYLGILMKVFVQLDNANKNKNFNDIFSTLYIGDEYSFDKSFLDHFIHKNTNNDAEKFLNIDFDFKFLRKYPVYKLSNNEYLFLFFKFLVDKFFNALTFDFYNSLGENSDFKKYIDFKSYYSFNFSQKYLFNKTIETTFKNYNASFFPEGYSKKEFGDYIVLVENKLLLFEFKDIAISADVKYSYDYEKIGEILKNRLIEKKVLSKCCQY